MKRNNNNNLFNHFLNINDFGPEPFIVNINNAARKNMTYRTALWTGQYLQLTVMSIPVGESIGLEIHPETDQYIRIESGIGFAQMGNSKNNLNYQNQVCENDAVFVPAGTWHNITNIGNRPMQVSTVYAPPHHPHGTVHKTKEDAEREEHHD